MKKKLLLIGVLTMICFQINAQNVNIPDANFKAYLVGNSAINTNGDSEIQVSEATAFTGVINCPFANITDLTGIEQFINLTELICNNNNLTNLNVSQNISLTLLHCYDNNLSNLNISQNTNLTELWCNNNSLGSIDLSQNLALKNLVCANTNLTALDVSNNTVLEILFCFANSLTALDVTQNTLLKELVVRSNSLTNLDTSQNTNLENLICWDNNLNSLDLSQNTALVEVVCSNNNLTELNMKNLSTAALSGINFYALNNPNLTCIEVDNVADATANWTNIDAIASFSLDCNYSLSLNEYNLAKNIAIYPNPATSRIYINSNEVIKYITIIDIFGKTIEQNQTFNNGIDISNLSNGIYFLQVSTSKGLGSKKFIKE